MTRQPPNTDDLLLIGSYLNIFLYVCYEETDWLFCFKSQTLLQGSINHNMNNELLVIGSPVVGRIIWVSNHRNQITTFWTPWTLLIKHKLSKRFKQEQKEHKFSRNVSGISHKEWSEMQNEMETIQQKNFEMWNWVSGNSKNVERCNFRTSE